jgi:hypothetical protein
MFELRHLLSEGEKKILEDLAKKEAERLSDKPGETIGQKQTIIFEGYLTLIRRLSEMEDKLKPINDREEGIASPRIETYRYYFGQ